MYKIIIKDMDVSDLVIRVTLSEGIDSIAYTASINMRISRDMSLNLLMNEGDNIDIIDPEGKVVFRGVIWNKNTDVVYFKTGTIECKERTVYLENSEDEYLFNGGTATSRARRICRDWNVPIGHFPDTGITLTDTGPRVGNLYDMMLEDLRETAFKGGGLFKYRFLDKLHLFKVGSNEIEHDISNIITSVNQTASLDGSITRVKVLGSTDEENKLSPVTGTFSKYVSDVGTIQKVVKDDKIESYSQAKARAQSMFVKSVKTIDVALVDSPSIRAGDKVFLNGFFAFATYVEHELMSSRGSLSKITLEDFDQVRSRYYAYTERDS